MEFGCFYNPRPSPGRCIKDINSKSIDKECQATETSCRLKDTSLSSSKLPPLSSSKLPPLSSSKLPPLSSSKSSKPAPLSTSKMPGKISGPISAYSGTYNDKIYNFFGDAHFGMENVCELCRDFKIDMKEVNPKGGESCWDISRLLAKVFSKASQEKKYIDFYIEIPFLSVWGFRPTQKDVEMGIDLLGYIYKIYYIFYNCLNKISCEYDTVRFHYVDVRLKYKSGDLQEITNEMEQFLKMSGESKPLPFKTGANDYESEVSFKRVEKAIDILARMILTDDRNRNSDIEDTDKLMRDLYFSGGQTMSGVIEPKNYRLFKLYLTSDDFSNEASKLIDLSGLKDTKEALKLNEILLAPTLIVNRKGKNLHRIRAQLLNIKDQDLRDKIITFLLNQYKTEVNNSSIIDLWRGIMIAYEGYINAKYRTLNDIHSLINKFSKEFENIMKVATFSITGTALLLDAYTLGRMFRSYDKPHPESFKNIVYAGAAHIDTYVNFFKNVLRTPFVEYNPNVDVRQARDISKLSRCLKVDLSYFL